MVKKGLKRQIRDLSSENAKLHALISAVLTEAGGELELPNPPKTDFKGFTVRLNTDTDMYEVRGT